MLEYLGWRHDQWVEAADYWLQHNPKPLPPTSADGMVEIQSFWQEQHVHAVTPAQVWASVALVNSRRTL